MMIKRFISLFMALLLLAALVPAYTSAASSGTTWSSQSSGTTDDFFGLAFGSNKYVAVSAGGKFLTSSDGASWSNPETATSSYINDITFGNNIFMAVGGSSSDTPQNFYWYSSNGGSTWVNGGFTNTDAAVDPVNISIFAVGYGANKFVAVGSSGLILSSSNGSSWTQIDTGGMSNTTLNSVRYGGSTFVAVGSSGKIITSSDGTTWANRTSGTSVSLRDMGYGNGTFVVVGNGGTILTSSDGVTWISQLSGTSSDLGSVSYGNGTFVAVGNGGIVLTSTDGTSWSTRSSGTTQNLNNVSYGTNGFLAVGAAGTIIRSALGVDYNGNGSTGGSVPVDTNAYATGATATVLGNTGSLVKTGSTFAGWNTAADGSGTDYAAASTVIIVTSDTTLYAKWTTSSSSPTPTPTATPGPVTPISLDATKYSLAVGGTHATIVYNNKNDNSSTVIAANSVTFTSSSTAVATVDASGVVTGVGKGTATISAYYAAGNNTRYVTVTVDPKAPAYLAADNAKTGAVTLSVYSPSGVPVANAAVKISAGTQDYPLVNTDNNGKVLAYLPAGAYNIVVYALNGTTLKNYTFKSLKVMAGQSSAPLVQPQFTVGSVDLAVATVNGADKKISGTASTLSAITVRDGATILGSAKADKTGKFSITLKTLQPGKTLAVTAVDADENEKTVSVKVPLVTAVTLTAATKDNDVDHDIAITFKDTVGLLVNTVTSVTYNGTALTKTTDYTLAAGKLTIKAGVIKAAGSHTIVVKSSAYEDATVTQIVKAGAPDATKSSYALSGTLAVGQTATATVTVKDQYGNLAAGKQVYADITITNSTKTTAEKYTIGGALISATAKGKLAGTVTDANGVTAIAVAIPATVDTGDGISIQLKVGATVAKATAFGNPIAFTK